MAKRLTDTEKWKDDWYVQLSNDNKIVWQWLLDNCNHAGICKRSIGILNLMCKVNYTEDEIIEILKDRILIVDNIWFIPKFLKFQYSTLLSAKPAILSTVKELFAMNCINLIPKSYGNDYIIVSKSFANHCQMIKDKDKDKDIVKSKIIPEEEKKEIENFSKSNNSETIVGKMIEVWNRLNKNSFFEKETDYSACLQIAYKVASVKGFSKNNVLKENLEDVVKSWEKILQFVISDDFFRNFTISMIDKKFQMVYQKMKNNQPKKIKKKPERIQTFQSEEEKQKAMDEWANSE